MVVTYETATDIIIPNILVQRKYNDGVHKAYRLTPHEGYVLHSPSGDVTMEDPDGNTWVEQYYYREVTIPVARPVSTWDWHAVLESDVPADMIFGGGNNGNHEVM